MINRLIVLYFFGTIIKIRLFFEYDWKRIIVFKLSLFLLPLFRCQLKRHSKVLFLLLIRLSNKSFVKSYRLLRFQKSPLKRQLFYIFIHVFDYRFIRLLDLWINKYWNSFPNKTVVITNAFIAFIALIPIIPFIPFTNLHCFGFET